ncbi:hypothetical protein TNCV_1110421 [Trichonephila clavipes]|nr:hypothetical protein TNCV_1110421 [Trichonephila clavipes]
MVSLDEQSARCTCGQVLNCNTTSAVAVERNGTQFPDTPHTLQKIVIYELSVLPAGWRGVGLSLAFCTQGCGFDPGPSRRIFICRKSAAAILHDYAACKGP